MKMAANIVGNDLKSRLGSVRDSIVDAAQSAGRDPAEITLIAVSKTHPIDSIKEARIAGQVDFGENRVQEAEGKIPKLAGAGARWHLIGHLQSNKARKAVQLFDVIQSVDSVDIAVRLDRVCDELNRSSLDLLVQVDLGGEDSKTGIDVDELPSVIDTIHNSRHLKLVGLMTLPPYFEDPEDTRPYFRRLRELRDELNRDGAFRDASGQLSMGMSHDFKVAISEGATIVRVGTAIFGERIHKQQSGL